MVQDLSEALGRVRDRELEQAPRIAGFDLPVGDQLIEQTFRVSDVKSSTDYQKIVEQLWQKLLDVFKEQSESQVRELQTWAAKSFEMQRASA